jgi:hypothetical protein
LESELPNSADVGGNPIREQGAAPRNSRRAPAEAGSFSARVPADTGGFESDLPAQLLEICRCRVISRIVGPQKQTAVIRFTPVARELLGQGSLEVTLVRRGSTAEAVDVALAPDTRLRIAIHRIDPDRDDVELLLSGYEIRGARLDSDRLVVPVLERATRRVE